MSDLKLTFRQLHKSPGFTTVAVISLALGIGANTAIFSVLNAMMLRALPVPNPHELREVKWAAENVRLRSFRSFSPRQVRDGREIVDTFPYPAWREFRAQAGEHADVFAFVPMDHATIQVADGASVADVLLVSGNFFIGYGADTFLGRPLRPEDDQPEAAPAAVISHRLWERAFGRDPAVLDRTLSINSHAFTIVGVLPRSHVGPRPGDPTDIYVPMAAQPELLPWYPLESSNHWWTQIMARLRSGADENQLRAALDVAFHQVLTAANATMGRTQLLLEDGSRGAAMGREHIAGPFRALFAAVGLVLLIACANLAGLLLARGAARRHELAVRAAIGASRWRLLRRSLAESAILASAGAASGLLLASWGKAVLMDAVSRQGNLNFDLRTDANVLLFALGVAALATLLFGLLPAWRASRIDPLDGLRSRAGIAAPRQRSGKILVTAQVALSTLLVVGAGLMVRSLTHLRQVDPGFEADNLLLFRLSPAQAGYSAAQQRDFFENVQRSLRALPGVRGAAMSDTVLTSGTYSRYDVEIPHREDPTNESSGAGRLIVSDGYFETMRIPLLLGRDFAETERVSTPAVAIVNGTFVRQHLESLPPVGQTFRMGGRDYRIIGVSGDTKYHSLRSDIQPMVYVSYRQETPGAIAFAVRTGPSPLSLVPSIRQVVASLDPAVPVHGVTTQEAQISESLAAERLFAQLGSSLAVLALGLSCVGVFGLMAFTVTRRTGEIGVRMAFGATGRNITWRVVREALAMAAAGLTLGVPLALGLSRLIRSQLYNVAPNDPLAYAAGTFLLLGAIIIAAWMPARRAARVDPVEALRAE